MTKKSNDIIPKSWRNDATSGKQPRFRKPMLAKLTHDHFSDPEWIYERKLDGERCIVVRSGKKVTLYSRNRKKLNDTYPELVTELARQPSKQFVVDGEIVAFKGNVSSFERLQARMKIKDPEEARKSSVAVYLYVFDVVHAEGYDVDKLPLKQRKAILKKLHSPTNRIRMTRYRRESGEALLKEACKKGWEGLIAKDFGATYAHSRSGNWLKFKCGNRQELVIGGFTDPKGERTGFGALLLGYYKYDKLQYAGKVGTGFDDATLSELGERLQSLERQTSPYDSKHPTDKNVHWVTPRLVAEIGFTEWTRDNRLRHPRYLGLRRDKKARSVVKEG